jgi:hypothetical protein
MGVLLYDEKYVDNRIKIEFEFIVDGTKPLEVVTENGTFNLEPTFAISRV